MSGKEKGTDLVEIELKLEFDRADRERLAAAVAAAATGCGTHHLISTYFDTPEREIAQAGYSLRVRRVGRRRIQTVKAWAIASAGLFERAEWEHPLRGDRPRLDARSGPLVQLVGADALRRIEPCFVTEVRRMLFRHGEADAAIEVAIDDGEVRAGARAEPLCEVELELRGAAPSAMFDFARALNEQVPLRLGVRPKAERGYALDAPPGARKAEPIALDRDGDAGEALRVIVQACIRQFRLNEALLLESGGAEALHQARVGLRRMRSALSIYAPLLVDDSKVALLSAELRWLAAELGGVRNIDVLIPRLTGDARGLLKAARDRAWTHVRAELTGGRARILMIDLAEWLALGTWRTEPAHPRRIHRGATPFASDLLEARRERLKRRGEKLAELDREHRHKVRIEAKKLRYAAEFFASLYLGDKARRRHGRFLEALEALQDVLGELNDLVVGPDVLAGLGIEAMLPGSGDRRRKRLLSNAEKSFDALMRAKRFW